MVDYKTAKGWLRPEEREELKRLAATAVPHNGVMINIGVEFGASIVCLRAGNPTARIIGLDLDMSKLVPEVYNECEPLLLEGDSGSRNIAEKVFLLSTYDNHLYTQLVFVDGSHIYDGVLADALYYCPMIIQYGIVVFHDCFDYDHPDQPRLDQFSAVNEAVTYWYNDNLQAWEELHSVGTMRIFRRR